MIVIASHDEIGMLDDLLTDFSEIDVNGHEIVVVDTNSQTEYYLQNIKQIIEKFPKVRYLRINYDCWDSGAYINAYFQVENKQQSYIFLQDSVRITNTDIVNVIDYELTQADVVPFFSFRYMYDNQEQQNWVERDLAITSVPEKLIFGPIFSVNKNTLDAIPKKWIYNSNPYNKLTACGMERKWSLMFHLIDAKKTYLQDILYHQEDDFWSSNDYFHKNIRKIFKRR